MILVIEDDEGRGWTVLEDIEHINLSGVDGQNSIIDGVRDTLNQIIEETDEYESYCLNGEDLADVISDAEIPEGEEKVRKLIGYSDEEDDESETEEV